MSPQATLTMQRIVRDPYGKADFWYQYLLKYVCNLLAVREAALAAGWIMAWKTFGGGCACSRLDHGFPDSVLVVVVVTVQTDF